MTPTATQQLAEVVLGEPLQDWVVARRQRGLSWKSVAAELAVTTNDQVQLNRETLRVWYRDVDRSVVQGAQ